MSKTKPTAILLLNCADQRGLVAAVSDLICSLGCNIVHADQHTDTAEGLFLQRVEFELEGLDVPRGELTRIFEPLALKFGMSWRLEFSDVKPRTAILVSRLGHCLYDLLARWRMDELHIEQPLIVSNHEKLEQVARDFGVEFLHLPVTPATKLQQEQAIQAALEQRGISLVVLARYMQVLSDSMVQRWSNRIINIHHSFLPAFAGARPYHQAHERGVKIIGATAHYVTAVLDDGPIIEQDVVRVSHRDSVADLVQKGRDLEKVVLARGLHAHLAHRVVVYGNKTVVFD